MNKLYLLAIKLGWLALLLVTLAGCVLATPETVTAPPATLTPGVTQIPPPAAYTPSPTLQAQAVAPLPTPPPTMLPPTPDPGGWLAQSLQVVSDQPFEIQAFSSKNDDLDNPLWSPDNNAVIIDRFVGVIEISSTQMLPQRELWVLELNGTGQLLDTNALSASWSPDGRAIAYLRRPSDAREYELWLAEWPLGVKRQLATNIGLHAPFWQGNDAVVFATAQGDLSSIDLTTLHVSSLTEALAFTDTIQGVNFVLSPVGDWLAVRPQEQEDKLTLLPLQNQGEAWIVPSRPEETYSFIVDNIAWSPDASRLAFTGFSWEVGEMIHVVDVYTRQEWNIPVYSGNRMRFAHFVSWSPDGNTLMFAARNENTRKGNLYLVNVDGGHLRNLSRDEDLYVRAPAWSPDGQRVFYIEFSDQDFTQRLRLMEVAPR